MRILFVVHQFMPEFATGTERVTLNLAKSAQRDGNEVEVVTRSLCGPSRWSRVSEHGFRFAVVEGIPVHALPGDETDSSAQLGIQDDEQLANSFARFLDDRGNYDVVHVTHPMRMVDAIETIRARNIPYVVTLTDFFFLCYRINLVRLTGRSCLGPAEGQACEKHCRLADPAKLLARQGRMKAILCDAFDVVACSTFVAGRFESEMPRLPIRVIEHGIDLLRFGRPSKKSKTGPVVFGYVGTLSDVKGVTMLAEGFAACAPSNARLELIGPTHGNGQVRDRLEDLAKGDQRIHITSEVASEQVPAFLATLDVLCLPSRVPETFSLTLHEGFAAGVPCLVSDLGYPPEVVRRNHCGQVLPSGEAGAWGEAIARIAMNPSVLEAWSSNVPVPTRVEEEGFLYSQLYQAVTLSRL